MKKQQTQIHTEKVKGNQVPPKHDLTEEQAKLVCDLAEKMTKQSNRATQYPLFYVYEMFEREASRSEDADRIAFMDDDWSEVDEFEDSFGNEWKLIDSEGNWRSEKIDQEKDMWEIEDILKDVTRMEFKEEARRVDSVGPFFTQEAAQAHIDANNYHYNKPYIYVDSAWRNYEMQGILKLIFELAGMEVPSQYK